MKGLLKSQVVTVFLLGVITSLYGFQQSVQADSFEEQARAIHDLMESLREQPDRPLASDLVRVFDPWPSKNPFCQGGQASWSQWHAQFAHDLDIWLPSIIAFLEKAYPGAIWAPLGRDAFTFGMVLDAFYTSIGQNGRVSPLRASTNTFQYVTNSSQLVRFLESAGFNFDHPEQSPPFIILDRTSFDSKKFGGRGSQSRQLIQAGYAEYQRRGGNPVDLVQKLNVLALRVGEPQDFLAFNGSQILRYFEYQRNQVATHGSLTRILQLTLPMQNLIDDYEWHFGYGPFRLGSDGRFEGEPTGTKDFFTREEILSKTWNTYDLVRRPEFLEAVKSEAIQIGYKFPMTWSFRVNPVDPEWRIRQAQASLKDIVDRFGPKPQEEQKYFSTNAQRMADWLEGSMRHGGYGFGANRMILEFIPAALIAHEQGKIGDRDIRRLIASAIRLSDMTDKAFLETLGQMVRDLPLLKFIFTEKAWSFSAEATRDHEIVGPKFQVIRQEILEPMGCELLLTKPEAKQELG